MKLSLLPILNFDGKKLQIDEAVAITANSNDGFLVKNPVRFRGVAANIGGTIELKGEASAEISMPCDRCAEMFEKVISFSIDERFKKEDSFSEAEENPDIVAFKGTEIDLSDIVYSNLYLNIPPKNLCKDDCKGLCSSCGTNLNYGDCTCDTDITDMRFDILDNLL